MIGREDFIYWLSTDAGRAALAGALGGVVRWLTLRERPKEAAASLFVGAACAVFLGPLVEPIMEPIMGKLAPTGDATGFASFVVGLGGISIASFVIQIFRARQQSNAGDTDAKS